MKREKSWKERGQALVEFALVLPILMLFVAGIFDFGRYIFTYAQASQQLRTAVREAPVIGFESDPDGPPYLQCETMDTIASNVFFAQNHEVTITYLDADDNLNVLNADCEANGEVAADDVNNGDIIRITSSGEVRPVFNMWIGNVGFEFIGQRTIVKTISIGSGVNGDDKDYDGLSDEWEVACYGDPANGSATDDNDCDGINNGQEEALDPTGATCGTCQ